MEISETDNSESYCSIIRDNSKKPSYLYLRNKKTGEDAVVDLALARYNRIAKGFLNKMRLFPYSYLKHITLTQKEESYHPRILHPFLRAMVKRYGKLHYIWTIEEQERGVLHWHLLVCFQDFTAFGREDIEKIQSYWKYGNVDVRPVRKPSVTYLMKYITKALDEKHYGLRKIGTSRIEGFFKQSWRYMMRAIDFFVGVGYSLQGMLENFWWHNGDAFLYEDFFRGRGRGKTYIYKRPREWQIEEYIYGGPSFGNSPI